jgi:uncharacterized membrane protein YgdD (TMEM256/DUF423 family)
MAFRIWLFISGVTALVGVAAAAYGAHKLPELIPIPRLLKIFEIAYQFNLMHAMALFGVAILMAATEGRRNGWGALMLNLTALAFLTGLVLFSGGIYYQVLTVQEASVNVVPFGGIAFMTGWAALSLSAFGYRRLA